MSPPLFAAQPDVSIDPTGREEVLEDTNITIICTDFRGYPPPNFSWFYNYTEPLTTGGRFTISMPTERSSVLVIDPVLPEDEGIYRCEATNSKTEEGFGVVFIQVLREFDL